MGEKKRKILIIDDDPANVKMLYRGLGHIYQVLGAISGEEGIETAKSECPDLILLDIQMAGISGYEVLTRLKKDSDTAHIPVIFLSGLDSHEDESYGLELGADDYIGKPFNLTVVRASIKTQLKILSLQEQIEFLENHCPLTKLANPRRIQSYFHNLVKQASDDKKLAIVYLDLNKFTSINEHFGRNTGDAVLKEIANRLREVIGKQGLVGRAGGDEFLIILRNMANKTDINTLCAKIKRLFTEPVEHEGTTLEVTTSIGVAIFGEDGDKYIELLKVADANMHNDKEAEV